MSFESEFRRQTVSRTKVNWAKECVIGALLSAAFTVMATNSGAGGITDTNLSKQLHDLIIMGGIAMAVICGMAAVGLIIAEALGGIIRHPHAMRFVKIFIP